jgi:hypothetical protein
VRHALGSALLVVTLLTGCAAENAGQRLQRISRLSDNQLLLVAKQDFPDGNPRHGTPTTAGSQALQDAVIADDGIAQFVAAHGLPDAIAVGSYAFALQLAYVSDAKVYTLEHSGAEWISPRAWTPSQVTATRPLSDDELGRIDPAHRAVTLRKTMDGYGRLQAVSHLVSAKLPPMGGPMQDYGLVILPASEVAARAFGGEPDDGEQLIAWVDPEGPQRDRVRAGDRIIAIDGVETAVAQRTGVKWEGTKRLRVRRNTETLEVEITPQVWTQHVRVILIPDTTPNAVVVPGGQVIVVSTGLLTLLPEDDALAAVLGHEYAHIALGHSEAPGTAQQLAVGVAALGLLPVLMTSELARPGTSRQVVQAMHKGFSRDQERDADRLSLQYTRAAGYDPHGALIALDRLQQAMPIGGVDQFFDLHPPYPERRALIEAELAAPAAAASN